jgi:PAS domain S-box-containing protein
MSGKKYSLTTTLFILYGILISAAAGSISWFSYQQSSAMLMKEFDRRAETIVKSVAYQAYEGIIVQDDQMLNNVCKGVLQEKNVSYVQIYDQNATLLYALYNEMEDRSDVPSSQRIENAEFVTGQIKKRIIGKDEIGGNFSVLDVRRAVQDQYITNKIVGYVRIGFSLADMLNLKKRLILSSALIFLVVIVTGLTGSIVFARKLSRSLNGIIAAMRNIIEHHDLSERIKQEGKIAEVNDVQVCFNQMTEKLEISQEALKESGYRLELALQSIDAGVWDLNITTGELNFSERMATMLGYSPDELDDRVSTWKKLMHPEDMPGVLDTVNAHLEGRISIYRAEHRLLTKSGEWKWILDTGRVVTRDEKGNPLRAIGTLIDITRRKENELELQKYQENLEQMVEDRTRDLEEAQKELINKAMEAGRAQLSAMVLHNIGNAITPIKVQIEGMKSDDLGQTSQYLEKCYLDISDHIGDLQNYVNDDPRGKNVFSYMGELIRSLFKQKKEKESIVKKMDEAVSYISEILTLQQAYAASEQETKERTDLNALIENAIRMQIGSLEKRQIIVKRELNPNIPSLLIDKNRLMQVIVNFIKNSYEAIDDLNNNNREKWIGFKSFSENGRLGFEITDSGIGIEPAYIDTIFDFGESHKGSSGFGLYYCKMFVEANKGILNFSSQGKGKGATVEVVFESNET